MNEVVEHLGEARHRNVDVLERERVRLVRDVDRRTGLLCELHDLDERRRVLAPVGDVAPRVLLPDVVVEDADELRLERLRLRLHVGQLARRHRRDGRVEVLVELRAEAVEARDEQPRARELVFGDVDGHVARVVRRIGLGRRNVADADRQLRRHRRRQRDPAEVDRNACAVRHVQGLLGEHRRPPGQRDRRVGADVPVQLCEHGMHVDRSRRESLERRLHRRHHEVRPKQRLRDAADDVRLVGRTRLHEHVRLDPPVPRELPQVDVRDSTRSGDVGEVADAGMRPVGPERLQLDLLQRLGRRAARGGVERDREVGAGGPGQRPQLHPVRRLGRARAGSGVVGARCSRRADRGRRTCRRKHERRDPAPVPSVQLALHDSPSLRTRRASASLLTAR